jgi:hypothetical protein
MGNICKFSIRSELAAPLSARDQKCTVLTVYSNEEEKKIFELKSAWQAMTAARSGWVTFVSFLRSELAAPQSARDQKCTVLTICTLTRGKKSLN